MSLNWTQFEELDAPKFTVSDFCETLDGGQAFRWDKTEAFSDAVPEYEGVFGKCVAKLKLSKNGRVFFSAPQTIKDARKKLEVYLDCPRNYADIRKSLADSRDPIMLKALEIYPTLRILRQMPSEALICFICSSSKRIVQIKQCVRALAENLGEEICEGKFALPHFDKIAKADIKILRECKLGFRAEYLKKTSLKIVADNFSPDSLVATDYESAKKYLVTLNGVGDKVADCILLFGASKMEAFPVDTWIKQAMTDLYSTPDDPKKIRLFAADKFGRNAGFAQQMIFAAKRKNLL